MLGELVRVGDREKKERNRGDQGTSMLFGVAGVRVGGSRRGCEDSPSGYRLHPCH